MPYIAKYINNLQQFGSVNLDLILYDSDMIMPDKRISKNFSLAEQIEEAILISEAQREISIATEEYNSVHI